MAVVLELPSALEDLDQLVQAPLGVGIVRGEHDKGEPGAVDRSEDLALDLLPSVFSVVVAEVVDPRLVQPMEEVRYEVVPQVDASETHEHVVFPLMRRRRRTRTRHGFFCLVDKR